MNDYEIIKISTIYARKLSNKWLPFEELVSIGWLAGSQAPVEHIARHIWRAMSQAIRQEKKVNKFDSPKKRRYLASYRESYLPDFDIEKPESPFKMLEKIEVTLGQGSPMQGCEKLIFISIMTKMKTVSEVAQEYKVTNRAVWYLVRKIIIELRKAVLL